MADVTLIKSLAFNMLLALDQVLSPNDIIEGFEEALDDYEEIYNNSFQPPNS